MSFGNISIFILKRLKEQNIKTIFAFQTQKNHEFLEEIEKYKGFKVVRCLTDEEAVLSANGYSKIKNSPSCVITSIGENTKSIIASLNLSFLEKIPIFILNISDNENISQKIYQKTKELYIKENITNTFLNCTRSQEKIIQIDMATIQINLTIEKLLLFQQPVIIQISQQMLQSKVVNLITESISRKHWKSNDEELKNSTRFIMDLLNNSSNPVVICGI
jgi:TPP-dependent 2-oxoacid decarboxylase